MKSGIVACAVAALSLVTAAHSFAQARERPEPVPPGSPQRDPGGGEASQRAARHGYARHDVDRRSLEPHPAGTGRHGEAAREDEFHYGARGPQWRRGAHVPPLYRSRQYVVNDWRAHGLSPPPRGCEWIQVGSDYVLVGTATGIIARLVLDNP